MTAEFQAIGAPQSWPTITACSSPSASSMPSMSATMFFMEYASISYGLSLSP